MNISLKKASNEKRQQQTTSAASFIEYKKLNISESDCEMVSKTKLMKEVFAYFLEVYYTKFSFRQNSKAFQRISSSYC